MKAYKEGRVIEQVDLDGDWEIRHMWAIIRLPSWDWENQDYKVSNVKSYSNLIYYPTGEIWRPVSDGEPNRSYMYNMLNVMESFAAGRKVEQREKGSELWQKVRHPKWNWKTHEYRIVT